LYSQIKTVPAAVVQSATSIDIFTGQEFMAFFQKLVQTVGSQTVQSQAHSNQPQIQNGVHNAQTTLFSHPQPQPQGFQPIYPTPSQPQIPVQSIINPAIASQPVVAKQSMSDTYNQRLQPQDFSGQPLPPQPMLTNQIVNNTTAVQQAAVLQQQHLQQQTLVGPGGQPIVNPAMVGVAQMPQAQPIQQQPQIQAAGPHLYNQR
jgi:hypothetical protein